MKLQVLAIGKARKGASFDLWADYEQRIVRMGPGLGFREFGLREFAEATHKNPASRMALEAQTLLAATERSTVVLLDEKGRDMTSEAFASQLSLWRDDGVDTIAFVIGGADGLDDVLRKKAALRLRFGHQTWPHLLVRAMLAEQIYRAMTLLAGHPYHRQ